MDGFAQIKFFLVVQVLLYHFLVGKQDTYFEKECQQLKPVMEILLYLIYFTS